MARSGPSTPAVRVWLAVAASLVFVGSVVALSVVSGDEPALLDVSSTVPGTPSTAASPPAPEPSSTPSPSPSPSPAASPSPEPSPSPSPVATVAPEPPAPPAATGPAAWSVDVHAGLGVWIDVFDWSMSHSGGSPAVTLATIDTLADRGVDTVYLQTSRITRPDAVLEPKLLQTLIDRIHDHDMAVVAWYLPTLVDPADDLRRVTAALALDVEGFALDIESQEVEDVAERSRRLVALSKEIRSLAGDRALVATVLPPVALEDVKQHVWPDFPWVELGGLYDVFQPMAYFTFRGPDNGEQWRDAEAYTAENVRRIRANTGRADVPVHVIGGIADRTTVADVEGMTRGALASGAFGLSLYDVETTGDDLWAPMQAWRELR